ncbi:MAG: HlyD family efflux transporter periplasmic adaptor subunit [Gammaproteobacteria bacterium]|nr:HlyD family efflux transporter periplasmic adaptor subunit [Gammaproteobacteria bacterium]
MDNSQQSPDWAQVAELRPQLRQHVHTYPQVYRGERWYVLHDTSSGRHLRFNESAYAFIGRLDGELRVQEIWQIISALMGEDAPNQDEIYLILTQLFAIDALRSGLPVDAREFFKRYQRDKHLRLQKAVMSPLAIRIPLFDPDQLLNQLIPLVRPLFSWSGAVLWSVVVGFACLLALISLPALDAAINRDMLAPGNLVLMALLYVIVKLVHEFGHALTVKMWGGEVHEMGITLLVLMPVPYVDASAAWAFRDKHKRVLVGAVGILAELFLAALALLVWLIVEPGLVRDAALNVVMIGSVSTLLFNANPLLRFDGYYVFQDLAEIPNLYTRSGRYYTYLMQRYLFGLDQVRSPQTAHGERIWFSCYGLAAFLYRMVIMVTIALFLAKEYLVVGVALAAWSVTNQLLLPLVRGIRFLITGPALAGRRVRAGAVTTLLASTVLAVLLFIPVSQTTRTDGVVWVPDQAQVFAETDGFVEQVLVTSGEQVDAGAPLLRMQAPLLQTRIEVFEAKRRGLEIRSNAERLQRRVQSQITREELASVEAELKLLRERSSALLVCSRVAGTVVLPEERTLQGNYLHQGQLVGYVVSPGRLIVRSVVRQAEIGLVRRKVSSVQVQLAERPGDTVEATILRQTPSSSAKLPSAALGAVGGGNIAVSNTDAGGRTAVEKVFRVDLELPVGLDVSGLGERAYVRFDHGAEPLARQWLRSGRQLLLSRLSL